MVTINFCFAKLTVIVDNPNRKLKSEEELSMEQNPGKIEVGNIFTVLDESDQEQEMEVLGLLTVENKDYAAVGFVEDIQSESVEDIDVFFFRVENEELSFIEVEEEFEKVSAAFKVVE